VEAEPLVAAIERFSDLYHRALARRFCWRLGVESQGHRDLLVIAAAERTMRERNIGPDAFFFAHRGGRETKGELAEALAGYAAVADDHPYWSGEAPQSMLIEEVEAIWAAIADRDDWRPLGEKIAAVRNMGEALGEPPEPAGHCS